jgi:hypothetical protein
MQWLHQIISSTVDILKNHDLPIYLVLCSSAYPPNTTQPKSQPTSYPNLRQPYPTQDTYNKSNLEINVGGKSIHHTHERSFSSQLA